MDINSKISRLDQWISAAGKRKPYPSGSRPEEGGRKSLEPTISKTTKTWKKRAEVLSLSLLRFHWFLLNHVALILPFSRSRTMPRLLVGSHTYISSRAVRVRVVGLIFQLAHPFH